MSFQISGLPVAPFTALFGLSDAQLAQHAAVRHTAYKRPGFPCRVSLRDAEPGETLLLLNYEHLALASPYRSRYAIYVREYAEEWRPEINEVPVCLRTRLLSVRGFDNAGMLKEADVVSGQEVEQLFESMFHRPEIAFLHVHNAKPGCFA